MKKTILLIGLIAIILVSGLYAKRKYYDPRQRLDNAKNEVRNLTGNNELREGDLIFQTSLSRQSQAIQLATKSEYSRIEKIITFLKQFNQSSELRLTSGLQEEKTENML